jgi:glycosyltransferase involved in cell wall biosynthesis
MAGPGVQRSTQFVRYLRDFNYDPIVFTIDVNSIKKIGSQMDDGLLQLLPKNLSIVRVGSAQSIKLINILTKLKLYRFFWFFLYPLFWERSALWPFIYFRKAKKIIKKENISIVYTSSAPYSSMLLGFFLQKKNKIKWVADLRDPYTDAYAWSFPSKIHWLFSKWIEKWLLTKPDILIVNTPEVKNLYLKKYKFDESKIRVITNGY